MTPALSNIHRFHLAQFVESVRVLQSSFEHWLFFIPLYGTQSQPVGVLCIKINFVCRYFSAARIHILLVAK